MFNKDLQSATPRNFASIPTPSKRGAGGLTVVRIDTPEELGEVIEASGKRLPHKDLAELRRLGDQRREIMPSR